MQRSDLAGVGAQRYFSVSTTATPVKNLSQAACISTVNSPCRWEASTTWKHWISSCGRRGG